MIYALFALACAGLVWVSYYWGKSSGKEENAREDAEDAKKDADIANEPNKRGSSLLDSLFRDK